MAVFVIQSFIARKAQAVHRGMSLSSSSLLYNQVLQAPPCSVSNQGIFLGIYSLDYVALALHHPSCIMKHLYMKHRIKNHCVRCCIWLSYHSSYRLTDIHLAAV